MTWLTISQKVRIYGYPDTWTLPQGQMANPIFSETDKNSMLGYLESLYNSSPTARGLLDTLAASGLIRISQSNSTHPGYWSNSNPPQLGFNFSSIDKTYYFNKQGKLVQELRELTIAHELAHLANPGLKDPTGLEADMNGAAYDFDGPMVRIQNSVAREIGANNNHQVSYDSGLFRDDVRFAQFETGKSYSYNKDVDIVRIGDGNGAIDNMDLSSRTDTKTSLMFGLSGDDVLRGSGGVDFLYGGKGADQLFGNGGDDYLVFDTDDKRVEGGEGFDTAVLTSPGLDAGGNPLGAEFNPSRLGLRSVERVYGTEGNDTITISSGGYVVDGAGGNDIFKLSGSAAITIEFRAGGGNDSIEGMFLPYTSGTKWITNRQHDTIKFVDLLPSDVSLVWNFAESGPGSFTERLGSFSIKINSTGDSISFKELHAQIFWYKNAPGDLVSPDVMVKYDTQNSVEHDPGNLFYVGKDANLSPTDSFYHFDLFMFKDGSRYSIVDLFQLSDAVRNEPLPATSSSTQGSSSSLSSDVFLDEDVSYFDVDASVFHRPYSVWHHSAEIV